VRTLLESNAKPPHGASDALAGKYAHGVLASRTKNSERQSTEQRVKQCPVMGIGLGLDVMLTLMGEHKRIEKLVQGSKAIDASFDICLIAFEAAV
jgi:hypothetical protein